MVIVKIILKKKWKVRQTINLLFFIFITNTQLSQAHNFLNGGCKNHCEESFLQTNLEKKNRKYL